MVETDAHENDRNIHMEGENYDICDRVYAVMYVRWTAVVLFSEWKKKMRALQFQVYSDHQQTTL